jgi:hypothetical protein
VAALTPLSVDGMIVAVSMTLLADSRSGGRGGALRGRCWNFSLSSMTASAEGTPAPRAGLYSHTDASRLLRGQYTSDVGREIFSAIAESTLLAAWMSYDSSPSSALAQRYFVQALALAQAGNDRLLGASILDGMTHQATYTGRFSEAANLARAALTGTRGLATAL